MAQTTTQFASDFVDALVDQGVAVDDAAALKTTIAAELTDWLGGSDAIPADLAYRFTRAVADMNAEMTSRYDFWTGTVDGGPNGDGFYNFTLTDGTTVLNPSLAKLRAEMFKGDPGKSVLFGTGSPASGTGIVGDLYIDLNAWDLYGPKSGGGWGSARLANGLQTIANSAIAAKTAAETAATASAGSATTASGAATTATTKAGEAATSATGAAGSATTAGTAATTATTKAGEASTSATAAATAKTGAEAAQAAAETARDQAQAAAPVVAYQFATSTTDADPGAGKLRFDTADPTTTSFLFIDLADAGGVDQTAWLNRLGASTNPSDKGTLGLRAGSAAWSFKITGASTSGSGYRKVPVALITGSASIPAANATVGLTFSATGSKGTDGLGAGDFVGPGTSTDNALVRFDGATGKAGQDAVVTLSDDGTMTFAGTTPQLVLPRWDDHANTMVQAYTGTAWGIFSSVFGDNVVQVGEDGALTLRGWGQIKPTADGTFRFAKGDGSASATLTTVELGRLAGVTSGVQSQLTANAGDIATVAGSVTTLAGHTITAGAGLTGGGSLAANRTLALDIVGQTEDTTPDLANDFAITWDASANSGAGGFKKVKLNKVGGASGLPVAGLLLWPTVATPAPATPDYLALNTTYLQASYPALFAKLGLSAPAIGTATSYLTALSGFTAHRLYYGLGKWWRVLQYDQNPSYNEDEGQFYYAFIRRIDVSSDLSTWTNVMSYSTGSTTNSTSPDGMQGGIVFGSTYAVVTYGRAVYVSTGSTFTKYATALPSGHSAAAIGFAFSKFGIITQSAGVQFCYTATDPTGTWAQASSNIGGLLSYPAVVTDGSSKVAVATGQSSIRYSSDWATWSGATVTDTPGSTYYSNGHSWAAGFYHAGAYWLFGTGTNGSSTSFVRIIKSTDGVNWSEVAGANLGSQPVPFTTANQIYAAGPIPGTNWAVIAGAFASSMKVAIIDLTKLGVNSSNGQVLASSTDTNLSVAGGMNSYFSNYINIAGGALLLNTSSDGSSSSPTAYKAPLSPDPVTEFKTPNITSLPTGTTGYIKA